MNLLAFTIRDAKADTYNTPFYFTTQGQALRAFADLANDRNSTVGQHPEDYALYFIGTFDLTSGDFTAEPTPKYLATANDFLSTGNAVPLQRVS